MSQTWNWTNDQAAAIRHMEDFIKIPIDVCDITSYLTTLSGSAGTGKTTLTKHIVNMIRKSGKQVLCVAPTHKARRVLSKIINTSSFLRIPTSTVSSLLGKTRAHGYVGTQNYMKGLDTKVGMYDFFIIDEISMVTTKDYEEMVALATEFEKKFLFIGDHLQIPNPAQSYVLKDNYLIKQINPSFTKPYQMRLNEIVRTDKSNPLTDLLGKVRDNVGTGFRIKELVKELDDDGLRIDATDPYKNKGYMLIENHTNFLKFIKGSARYFKDGRFRIISYTNHSVRQYNKIIRTAMNYAQDVVLGELLTGYNNVGPNNDLIVENGQDYHVIAINEVTNMSISANGKFYNNLTGKVVKISELESAGSSTNNVFLLDLNDNCNSDILEELVFLAMKVNKKGSTKIDYRNYMILKSQMLFMEDLYKYRDSIYTSTEFKQIHPLLFTKTTDVLTTKGETIPSEIVNKLDAQYPNMLSGRVTDELKGICRGEQLADAFQVLEKDMSYGYSLTSHKSQGSTYHTVFMDESDFNSLRDRWSWKHHRDVRASLERDQLKYVALSRPSNVCYVLSC